ncbi:GNAT family N-acetyltransferase [Nocardioides terrigena]|uniref:GNAT family N-acetyltransferase n=1 Tax=Nocardioides terrigena TaxID=424797 RepID=UPI003898FE43
MCASCRPKHATGTTRCCDVWASERPLDPMVTPCRTVTDVLPAATPRLRFREMTEADLPDIATLEIGGSRGATGWIEWNLNNYADHEFGLWIIETHSGEFVGDCGLTMQEVEGQWLVEAGWHVRSSLRRQGYAAEAAAAVREAAGDAGIDHLIAIIRPDNVASQGVAAKIGLALEREIHKNGGPALVFGADLTTSVGH